MTQMYVFTVPLVTAPVVTTPAVTTPVVTVQRHRQGVRTAQPLRPRLYVVRHALGYHALVTARRRRQGVRTAQPMS